MTLRLGLLGTGGIGKRHIKAAQSLGETYEIVACCGREQGKAEAFAQEFEAAAYSDFAAMLAAERLDALVVALPPFAHDGQVESAARAGVHVLVEKPIALDLVRARSQLEATRHVVAACAFMYRFGEALERWEAIESGRPAHFSGFFHSNALHSSWWRSRGKSGGQVVEQFIHVIDICRHLMGMPQTVYARSANLFHRDVPGYDSEDVAAILLGWDDGRVAALHCTNAAIPGRWDKGWKIVAERATGIFADFNRAELVRTAPEVTSEMVDSARDVFAVQLADFAAAIAGNRAPKVPLSDGESSLRIALAAQQSADERRELSL